MRVQFPLLLSKSKSFVGDFPMKCAISTEISKACFFFKSPSLMWLGNELFVQDGAPPVTVVGL